MGKRIEIKYKGKVLETVDINTKSLYIRDEGIESIRDLEGLDRLVSLEVLDLSENQIGRIEGLDQLVNLNELNLNGNQIAKIEGLDRLVKLKRLDLGGNQIGRIEGLDRLEGKLRLDLAGSRIAQPTNSQSDSENCEKMNKKAKEALKVKDFATSTNILDGLVALCTRNLQAIRIKEDKYTRDTYLISHDVTYQNWNVVLQSNLKNLKKAKKASEGQSGLSEEMLARIVEKWKDHLAVEEKEEEAREYHPLSIAELYLEFYVMPELVANGIFIGFGLLFGWLIPSSFIIMFWCTLLIAGTVGTAIPINLITSDQAGDDPAGVFGAVIRVNGFVYAGEFVLFLIVSLQLAGVVGIIILAQFIGEYCAAYLVTSERYMDLIDKLLRVK